MLFPAMRVRQGSRCRLCSPTACATGAMRMLVMGVCVLSMVVHMFV
jgi:hypothetical protein